MRLGDEVQHIPGFLLWQVGKLWQRHLTTALKTLQLTNTQFVVLANVVRLTREQIAINQLTLSNATKVDPMTMSSTLRVLEQKKLIVRTLQEQDKRAYAIRPTQAGTRLADRALQEVYGAHQTFFSTLGDNEALFVQLLQRLIEANDL